MEIKAVGPSFWVVGNESNFSTSGNSKSICGFFVSSFFSIILGTCLGLLLSTNIDSVESFLSYLLNFELWNNEIRYLTSMPYSIRVNDIVFIVSISLFSSLIASYVPILRIFKIKPNLILRWVY